MNNQKPLKNDRKTNGNLIVHSVFYTIQGEGPLAGFPAVFVRLSGCNLQCPACDTEYTGGNEYDPETLLDAVREIPGATHEGLTCPVIVLTGGEPLRQAVDPFVQLAMNSGFIVQIETNGIAGYPFQSDTIPPDWRKPMIVCSPKTKFVDPGLFTLIDCFKYVIEDGHTNERGLPTRALQGRGGVYQAPEGADIYVQPIDEPAGTPNRAMKNQQHLATTVAIALTHGYKLCLQIHKIANLP